MYSGVLDEKSVIEVLSRLDRIKLNTVQVYALTGDNKPKDGMYPIKS
jgi:hypothetical protein